MFNRTVAWLLFFVASSSLAAERQVDPTWLRRSVSETNEKASEFTTNSCHYKPMFGAGDADARIVRGIARFGEMTVDPGGASAVADFPAEEQVFFIMDGSGSVQYGETTVPVRKNDFMYLPPGVKHGISNSSGQPCRLMVMGFKIPAGTNIVLPAKALVANSDEVKKEQVGGHPPSTLYQLLMGDTRSKRDRLAAAQILTSLYIMEFDSGGTNFPHHHDREEEIYLVLNGHGDMVAGGGTDGIEGKHPAKAGDAFFFRLNCTVGFYSGNKPGEEKAHILAVRSLYPFGNR
jgi:mannose-6-phosphate isomerase-like protein (cupin superfamily)